MIFSLVLINFVRSFRTETTRKSHNGFVSCCEKSCFSKYISDHEQQMKQHRGSCSDILHKMFTQMVFNFAFTSRKKRELEDKSLVFFELKIGRLSSKKLCQL